MRTLLLAIVASLTLTSCAFDQADVSASVGYGPLKVEYRRPAKGYGKQPPLPTQIETLPPSPVPDLPWWKKAFKDVTR